MRRAAKRDSAEGPIIEALRKAGAYVVQLSQPGVPDLMVLYRSRWYALEVKTGKGRTRKHQEAQLRFLALTGTPIVRIPYAALREIGAMTNLPVEPLDLVAPPSRL
jgi:hypothetical protein